MKKKLEIGKTYITGMGDIRTVNSIEGNTVLYYMKRCNYSADESGLFPFSLDMQEQSLNQGYLTEYIDEIETN